MTTASSLNIFCCSALVWLRASKMKRDDEHCVFHKTATKHKEFINCVNLNDTNKGKVLGFYTNIAEN
jgi:hypothetical protein